MEKLFRNLHVKLQEMCDCYMETDFKAELNKLSTTGVASDVEEEALKYLALALLYSVSEKADKLEIKQKNGEMKVSVKSDGKDRLPAPPAEISSTILAILRDITDLRGDKGETLLALGLRNSQLELKVQVKKDGDKESVKISLPLN